MMPTSAVSLTVATAWVTSLISEILTGGFGLKIVSPGELVNITLEGGSFASKTLITNAFSCDKPPLSLQIRVILCHVCFSKFTSKPFPVRNNTILDAFILTPNLPEASFRSRH